MGLVATNKWIIKLKNMTYIVGGKINNKAFILVDKVVNDEPTESVDKLYHSVSNKNIYISLTGDGELMDSIKELDNGLKSKNKKLEISDEFIKNITTDFLSNYSENILKRTSLYIIDNGDFKRIDINFDGNKYIDHQTIEFDNNEFIYCNSINKEITKMKIKDIMDFSQFYIYKIFDSVNIKYTKEEYFNNGFSYIEK